MATNKAIDPEVLELLAQFGTLKSKEQIVANEICNQSEPLEQTLTQEHSNSSSHEEFSSIDDIIDYARRTNKVFKTLYDGSVNHNKYPTPKDAEKELILRITAYTQDPAQIQAILRNSKIFRDAWNTGSYLPDLINEVLTLKENEPVKQNKTDSKPETDKDIDEDIDYDEQGFTQEELDEAEAEALRILENGDPINYILDTVIEIHVGDEKTQEGLALSISSQSCLNTEGIQISINGKSGTGKSSAVGSHVHLVPARYKRVGDVSPKALYYMNLEPGMIIYVDDKDPDPALQALFKQTTTNYQGYTVYNNVKDQNALKLLIPPRINFYFTSVESHVGDQILNRQFIFDSDTSEEQDERVFKLQKKTKGEAKTKRPINKKVLICRRIYAHIKEQLFKVKIPFIDQISMKLLNDRRLFPQFCDLIYGYAIFKYQQREIDEEGCLIADVEDFKRAKELFESRLECVVTKLNENERKIIRYIIANQGSTGCTIQEIAKGTKDLSEKTVGRLTNGRKERHESGLIDKYAGLHYETCTESKLEQETIIINPNTLESRTVNIGSTSRKVTRYKIDTDKIDIWELFDKDFITLES